MHQYITVVLADNCLHTAAASKPVLAAALTTKWYEGFTWWSPTPTLVYVGSATPAVFAPILYTYSGPVGSTCANAVTAASMSACSGDDSNLNPTRLHFASNSGDVEVEENPPNDDPPLGVVGRHADVLDAAVQVLTM
jgi:hypothetical protein